MLPRRGRRRRRGVTIPPVPAEALPLTTFCPRRGMPYTVAHGDDCEHLWVVRDMRAPVGGAGGDPRVRAAYPSVLARAPRRLRQCPVRAMGGKRRARWGEVDFGERGRVGPPAAGRQRVGRLSSRALCRSRVCVGTGNALS